MKRHGYLYEKVMTYENVCEAWRNYNANRPARLRVPFSESRAQGVLAAMQSDFRRIVGIPRRKTIYEGGKMRELRIPSFRSSIAQIALWNVCGPFVERRIHAHSYSSRLGMGGHRAFRECQHFVRRHRNHGAKYCLYFDVRKYYQHIDHRILMSRLSTVFKDRRILDMFRAVIDSSDEGLPVGYPFAHALANLYLVPLYRLIMSDAKVSRGFVYMDNHVFFSRWKKTLRKARESACAWLSAVGCKMKGDWQIFPVGARAVKICGFAVRAQGTPRLYRRLWRNILKNLDRLLSRRFAKADYLALMSRKGWLMAAAKTHTPAIITHGGAIW